MERKKKPSKTPLFSISRGKMPDLDLFGSKLVLNLIKSPQKSSKESSKNIKESKYSDNLHANCFSFIRKYKKTNLLPNSQLFRDSRYRISHNAISSSPKTPNSLEISPKSYKSSRSSFASKSRLRTFKEKIESLIN